MCSWHISAVAAPDRRQLSRAQHCAVVTAMAADAEQSAGCPTVSRVSLMNAGSLMPLCADRRKNTYAY